MSKFKLGILISGRGSNMVAVAKAIRDGRLDAETAVVISNKSEAKGLEKAREMGLETRVLIDEDAIAKSFIHHKVDLVVLAGYMRILGPKFIQTFQGKLINIHPSLLPKFKGLHAQKQALEAGETESGCTVHYVNEEVDGGEIIAQKKVPILPGDTVETLSERILSQEHQLLPESIQKIIQDKKGASRASVN